MGMNLEKVVDYGNPRSLTSLFNAPSLIDTHSSPERFSDQLPTVRSVAVMRKSGEACKRRHLRIRKTNTALPSSLA
ncbi:hypothetical protein Fmac_006383 [Flemingia macrophylla]|uniref:Uncharacterized protein n=1 Tax=Flemingia macrophylla TaxID=520843 RepID=A0ABD1NAX6_9FABA